MRTPSTFAFRLGTLGVTTALSATAMATVVFNLDTTIEGFTPTGDPPFLVAAFETISVGTVQVTLTNTMPVTNFVDNWVFNIEPFMPVSFTHVSGVQALAATSGSNFTNGGSNVKAGLFDVEFHFPTANSDPNHFHGGATSVYLILGTGLTEGHFASLSVDDLGSPPSRGGWLSAAHVQGFGQGLSGSIGVVPEPMSLAVLGLGLAAMVRRRKSQR